MHLFNQNTVKTASIVKHYYNLNNCIFIYFAIQLFLWSKLNFQHHYSVFCCSRNISYY